MPSFLRICGHIKVLLQIPHRGGAALIPHHTLHGLDWTPASDIGVASVPRNRCRRWKGKDHARIAFPTRG